MCFIPPSIVFVIKFRHNLVSPLQWRHNERNGVSHNQRLDCLLKRLFRRKSKEISKVRVTGLCEGNSLVTGEFASYAENVSIWWRHHVKYDIVYSTVMRDKTQSRLRTQKGQRLVRPHSYMVSLVLHKIWHSLSIINKDNCYSYFYFTTWWIRNVYGLLLQQINRAAWLSLIVVDNIGLNFTFSNRINHWSISVVTIDCPCGVWCYGLIIVPIMLIDI